ncbi:MAG: hypothetical protein JWP38_2478 [Herbaspirillum sp.]|nr:hypothetical protein [Herbaspirillum sp.]
MARYPGICVVTVFAAAPERFSRLTSWDFASGFHSAREAAEQRRREDDRALSLLSAHPIWMDFCDSQYDATPSLDCLRIRLLEVLRMQAPDTVLLPAGLFHSDHALLHRALLSVQERTQHAETVWLMYEDALYRRIPGLLQRRLAELAQDGICATPIEFERRDDVRALKRRALACYASQLRALTGAANGYADAFLPERYWRLDPPSPAPGSEAAT